MTLGLCKSLSTCTTVYIYSEIQNTHCNTMQMTLHCTVKCTHRELAAQCNEPLHCTLHLYTLYTNCLAIQDTKVALDGTALYNVHYTILQIGVHCAVQFGIYKYSLGTAVCTVTYTVGFGLYKYANPPASIIWSTSPFETVNRGRTNRSLIQMMMIVNLINLKLRKSNNLIARLEPLA